MESHLISFFIDFRESLLENGNFQNYYSNKIYALDKEMNSRNVVDLSQLDVSNNNIEDISTPTLTAAFQTNALLKINLSFNPYSVFQMLDVYDALEKNGILIHPENISPNDDIVFFTFWAWAQMRTNMKFIIVLMGILGFSSILVAADSNSNELEKKNRRPFRFILELGKNIKKQDFADKSDGIIDSIESEVANDEENLGDYDRASESESEIDYRDLYTQKTLTESDFGYPVVIYFWHRMKKQFSELKKKHRLADVDFVVVDGRNRPASNTPAPKVSHLLEKSRRIFPYYEVILSGSKENIQNAITDLRNMATALLETQKKSIPFSRPGWELWRNIARKYNKNQNSPTILLVDNIEDTVIQVGIVTTAPEHRLAEEKLKSLIDNFTILQFCCVHREFDAVRRKFTDMKSLPDDVWIFFDKKNQDIYIGGTSRAAVENYYRVATDQSFEFRIEKMKLLEKELKSKTEEMNNLKKELESETDKRRCRICFENASNYVFIPCGHLGTCDGCSKQLKECPFCNKEIMNRIKVYFS